MKSKPIRRKRDFRKMRGAPHTFRAAGAIILMLAMSTAFGADSDEQKVSAKQGKPAASRSALFGDDDDAAPLSAAKNPESLKSETGLKGFLQFELARTVADPEHWSKMRTRAELASRGELGNGLKWKLSARLDYDAVYDHTSFYSAEVKNNQRFNATLRENYLDFSSGNWDFRVGRQHVVWGEMVGMFFADVVSARDMREFILPDFESIRIPQWAARAEYFRDDFHAEALWIPVASYDEIGKPGGDFYPYQPVVPGFTAAYKPEIRPARNLQHGNYGIRLSTLKNGWDVSGFFYSSMDNAPTFYREIVGSSLVFQARHERIDQWGGTLAKDFGSVVLKGETVYTQGRKFGVSRLSVPNGVVAQDTLDWALGLDFSLPAETRFNVQLFQRYFPDHDPDIVPRKSENGYSLYLTKKFGDSLEAQALWISSLNRGDWLFRPKLTWAMLKNWRWSVGADIFKGPPLGLFGQYDRQDRIYSEIRYSF
ncbi:MAG: DUF1302 family protein [Betaproteobacteria bacterium]